MNHIASLSLAHPIIQAPMAGVSTPELAAAVSNAGALGSVSVGATDANGARAMIAMVRARTNKPFNVNLFVHPTPVADAVREASWVDALATEFAQYGAEPPSALHPAYPSFNDDAAMQQAIIDLAPPVVSFHFGLPPLALMTSLKQAGCTLLASATNLEEAAQCAAFGIDAVIAQGAEAGGHRGMFDPAAADDLLSVAALVQLFVAQQALPVIAAGGIMNGAAIRAMLDLGAVATQLGTAFIACPESAADDAYRARLAGAGNTQTRFTSVISGRPARSLPNSFTAWGEDGATGLIPPEYPIAYDAGKALAAAARAVGDDGYNAQWAGQGAHLSRPMPAAQLVETLVKEMA